MDNTFYDIVDSEGNVVKTAMEQMEEANAEIAISGVRHSAVLEFPEPKPEPTEGELKKLRKLYVTNTVAKAICGHRLDLERQPRHRSCETCWFAWFNAHGEMVQQLDEMHTTGNDDVIIKLQGDKFYKMWRKFMATIAQWKQVTGE